MNKLILITLANIFPRSYISINLKFIQYCRTHTYALKMPEIKFIAATGSLPYFIWNGGPNSNFGPGILYKDILDYSKISEQIPLRIDCSNSNLEQTDYTDTYCNLVLTAFQNGSNSIEVSDMMLYEYLKKHYPDYRYILSNRVDLINSLDIDTLNSILDFKKFDLIQLPYNLQNSQNIKNISDKSKLEIQLFSPCIKCNIETQKNCLIKENLNQLFYSNDSIFGCNKCSIAHESIEAQITKFQDLGINHFSLFPFSIRLNNPSLYLKELVSDFIKSEYQLECLCFCE